MMRLLCGLTMAAVAEAGCKPAPRLDGRRARRGLAWTRAHRFAEGDASRYASLLRVPTRLGVVRGRALARGQERQLAGGQRRGVARRLPRLRRAPLTAVKLRPAWRRRRARRLAAATMPCWPRRPSGASRARRPRKHPATLTLRAHTREDKKWLQHAYGPTLSMGHPGCVERRQGYDGKCLFDGRFSLASVNNRTWLYARGNTNPEGGGRAVFVAQKTSDGWGRLKPIEFQKGARHPFDRLQRSADVYYGAVNANPALQGTLLGLFPAASRDRAAIMIAVSCDGLHFPRRSRSGGPRTTGRSRRPRRRRRFR